MMTLRAVKFAAAIVLALGGGGVFVQQRPDGRWGRRFRCRGCNPRAAPRISS